MSDEPRAAGSPRLRIRAHPIACKGHGMCAELFPERIRLDDWGYPIIDPRAVPEELMAHARRAIAECPRTALRFAPVVEAGAHVQTEDAD